MNAGNRAEAFAAKYLKRLGFEIVARNWKTKWYEIDIVAKRGGCMHFVEVKFRSSDYAGKAISYITPRKLEQMRYGANSWVSEHEWEGDFQLDVITLDKNISLQNLQFIQNVD